MKTTFYTPEEAAKILGVSRATVYRWMKTGVLRAVKISRRTYRIPEKEVKKTREKVKEYVMLKKSKDWVPLSEVAVSLSLDTNTLKKYLKDVGIRTVSFKNITYELTLVDKRQLLEHLCKQLGRNIGNDIPRMLPVYNGKGRSGIRDREIIELINNGQIPCLEIYGRRRILKEDYDRIINIQSNSVTETDKPQCLQSLTGFIPLSQVAAQLKVSVNTLRKALKESGYSLREHNGVYYMSEADYEAFMKNFAG